MGGGKRFGCRPLILKHPWKKTLEKWEMSKRAADRATGHPVCPRGWGRAQDLVPPRPPWGPLARGGSECWDGGLPEVAPGAWHGDKRHRGRWHWGQWACWDG